MKRIRLFLSLLFVSYALLMAPVRSQTPTISLTSWVTGLSTPVGIEHCGDSRLFVVEQTGRIKIVQPNGTVNATPFLNVTSLISTGSERGLLGLAFHPNYAQNGYFYTNYTRVGDGRTVVSRWTRSAGNPDVADPASEQILLTIYQPYSNHNCGRVMFGDDGYLYIGMGDGGNGGDPGNRAQNPDTLLGKILRIDVNSGSPYAIPPSNPYYGGTSPRPEIWAMGVRNPWRFTKDRLTGDIWIADVGQNTWEEVNIDYFGDAGGKNWGWRCYEGTVTYNSSGCQGANAYDSPIYTYNHTGGNCSITGGYRYRGAQEGDLYGWYVWIDLCSGLMGGIRPNGTGGWTNTGLGTYAYSASSYRWSTFGEDSRGELYLANVGNNTIYKVKTTSCIPTAAITNPDSTCMFPGDSLVAIRDTGLTFQWYRNGTLINGATASSYIPSQSGQYTVAVQNTGGCRDTSAAVSISFFGSITASITGLDPTHCLGDARDTLVTSPVGGILTGPLLNGNQFDCNLAGTGQHIFTYTYTDAFGCAYVDSDTTIVGGGATVTIAGLNPPYCIGETNDVLSGNPGGGVFSGDVVNGNEFSPTSFGTGNHNITYTYTDAAGCQNAHTETVLVGGGFNVSFTPLVDTAYCLGQNVNITQIGNPPGGTFSGPANTGNIFNPGTLPLGTFYTSYSVTDSANCRESDTAFFVIQVCSGMEHDNALKNFQVYPNPTDGKINLTWKGETGVAQISLMDLSGRNLGQWEQPKGKSTIQIQLPELARGEYILQVKSGGRISSAKILLQK